MRKLFIIAILAIGLFGCASYNVNVSGYGGAETYPNKTYDFILSKELLSDLEAMGYVEMLENQLLCIGWKRDTVNHDYLIQPDFGIFRSLKDSNSSNISVGGGIGFFGGSRGSGVSIGSFLGTSTGSPRWSDYTKYIDVKLFQKNKTEGSPLWQGKIYVLDSENDLKKVMPVLVKYTVDNFGKTTDGNKEFTFYATDSNIEELKKCPTTEK
jgi:hypothetical protein